MCSLTLERADAGKIEGALLLQNVFSYSRMCSLTLECVRMGSLTLECVLVLYNVFSYSRMCSPTIECVLLP